MCLFIIDAPYCFSIKVRHLLDVMGKVSILSMHSIYEISILNDSNVIWDKHLITHTTLIKGAYNVVEKTLN